MSNTSLNFRMITPSVEALGAIEEPAVLSYVRGGSAKR